MSKRPDISRQFLFFSVYGTRTHLLVISLGPRSLFNAERQPLRSLDDGEDLQSHDPIPEKKSVIIQTQADQTANDRSEEEEGNKMTDLLDLDLVSLDRTRFDLGGLDVTLDEDDGFELKDRTPVSK